MIVPETVIVAFSIFSAIPMPSIDWNERNMRWSLCAFPLVGAVVAAAMWGWSRLCAAMDIPVLCRAAGLCLLPVLLTGGIHLDGYADTWDALASHGDLVRKQEILKDPHLGAFAAIHLCSYFILDFALWTALPDRCFPVLIGLFCLSRTLSGFALTSFPIRPGSGLARTFADAADKKRVGAVLAALCVGLALLLACFGAAEAVLAAGLVFIYYRRMCEKSFGGLSGDLAGWFLQSSELWMLAAMTARFYLERAL